MIDLKLIYELYIEHINFSLKKLLQDIVEHTENHKKLKKLLTSYENSINTYSNHTLEEILSITNIRKVNTITFPRTTVYKQGKAINFKAIKLYIEKYVWYNTIIVSLNKKIDKHNKELINFKVYSNIINKFNTKVIDKVVNKNYFFEAVPSFGALSVIKNHNERNRVDWGKSNKKKKEIIAKGGIPYIKADAESNENYKGEKWLFYHPIIDFFLHWHTKWITIELNPFIKDYKYTPARGVNSIVTKLQNVKQDREYALSLYTRTLN